MAECERRVRESVRVRVSERVMVRERVKDEGEGRG